MQRFKTILYNASFSFNCLLFFLLIFERGLSVPPWVQAVGRMHPLVLHFPIVLMLLCFFWELMGTFKKSAVSQQSEIGDVLLLITSLTAVLTALMGLLLSKEDGYTPELLFWHKWTGVSISFLTILWYGFREPIRRIKFLLVSTVSSALVILVITGHLGSGITHGENFVLAPVTKDKVPAKVLFEDALIYANMVQPILQSKCMSCHNENKAKGELVMETFAQLLKGGKSGVLWDSAQKGFGLLLNRIHLPIDNKKHMPPSGKPQLSEAEVAILYHWISSGSNAIAKVIELPPTDTLRMLATSLFNTIETDEYSFKPAEESKIKALSNNYRFITSLSLGSPALGVEFFGAAQFRSEQLKELLVLKEQIVSLNLNKIPVTDADLATISQFINLRKLNLSFTDIKGTGLVALNQLKLLKQLSLSGTGVNLASLGVLTSLPKLSQLYLWSTPAQSQPMAAIQKQFKNTIIETGFSGDSILIKLNPPTVENEELFLLQPALLKLKNYVKGVDIRFTADGSEPDSIKSLLFKGDFMINKTMTIKARAYKSGWLSSDPIEKTFYKAGVKIDSISLVEPSKELLYKTLSPNLFTDGHKGDPDDFSFGGKWIAFKGQNMQVLSFFDTVPTISSVTISSLVNMGSYIMPPQEIQIWAGRNSDHLKLIKKISPDQPLKDGPNYSKGYTINFPPIMEQCLKIVLIPLPKLPLWHSGKGKNAWVFVDEIFLN